MGNKFDKELFSYLEEEDLNFTKEDRMATIKKIQKSNKKKSNNIPFFQLVKRFAAPMLGTVIVLILGIGLLLTTLHSNNEFSQGSSDIQQTIQQEEIAFSALLMGENPYSHRSNINILLTYNSSDNSLKLVPIPRDTYVDILLSTGVKMGKDKLMHALAYDQSSNSAMMTVSNLFDFPIDYYFVIPEGDLYAALEVEQYDARDKQDQTNEIGKIISERLTLSNVKHLFKESETNIPSDIFNQFLAGEDNSISIEMIDMVEKGTEEMSIDGAYYVEINEKVLETTSNILKRHLGLTVN